MSRRSALSRSGSTSAWRKLRAQVLSEQPVCAMCGTEQATEVDHIVEREHGGDDRRDNLRGLCRLCHAGKSASASRGRGRKGGGAQPPSRDW